jgi:hypothetical protein
MKIITTNEGEHEFEVTPQTQEEESEIQEEMSEIPQHQVDVGEGIEEISLGRSTRVPQISTRLHNFVTYKVQYPIQNFLSYDNIAPRYIDGASLGPKGAMAPFKLEIFNYAIYFVM